MIKDKARKSAGFTLVELLAVFFFLAILGRLGIASLAKYGNIQTLTLAAKDVAGTLTLAKERALYQVVAPCVGVTPLKGYRVTFCYSNDCRGPSRTNDDSYEVVAICGNADREYVIQNQILPANIQFVDNAGSPPDSFFFSVITGDVSAVGSSSFSSVGADVVLTGYGATKTVHVSPIGGTSIR